MVALRRALRMEHLVASLRKSSHPTREAYDKWTAAVRARHCWAEVVSATPMLPPSRYVRGSCEFRGWR